VRENCLSIDHIICGVSSPTELKGELFVGLGVHGNPRHGFCEVEKAWKCKRKSDLAAFREEGKGETV